MKRALIVDDSKTAQIRLKKMLSRFNLHIDLAASAEEALGYLTYESPNVIFLDHHMEGMDGLEALKIIKANPNTAMIPVIMYTSQQGDVYVGQARALGALDILSKEVLKPSNLERVLSNLGINTVDDEPAPETEETTQVTSSAEPAKPAPTAIDTKPDTSMILQQVQTQIARLFELHIADVRQQITDNSRVIIKKLSKEIEKSSEKEPTVGDVPLSVVNAEMNAEQRRASRISGSMLLLVFISIGVLALELYQTRAKLNTMNENYTQLLEESRQEQQLISELSNIPTDYSKPPEDEAINSTALIDAIGWAIDTDLQFDYNTQPLNETRVIEISNLVYRLSSAGFRGIVELNIHFGNVCLQRGASGNWRLADDDVRIEDCTMLEDLNQEFSASDYLSVSYLNFEQTATPLKNGLIEMEVTSMGLASPRYEYPSPRPGMLASTWNAIAVKNNRVTVEFSYL